MRMNADGRVDELIFVGQLNPAVERTWTRTATDRDNSLNASFPRPGDYLFAVGIKLLHLEMCVGIYKHGVGRWSEVFRATDQSPSAIWSHLLLQPRAHRHILQEAGKNSFSPFRRRSHDHPIGFQPAQFARRKIGDDHYFASN